MIDPQIDPPIVPIVPPDPPITPDPVIVPDPVVVLDIAPVDPLVARVLALYAEVIVPLPLNEHIEPSYAGDPHTTHTK